MAKDQGGMVFQGENITGRFEGSILHLTIDTTKRLGASASGKSLNVAVTRGNRPITLPDGTVMKLGLNCYVPNKGEAVQTV